MKRALTLIPTLGIFTIFTTSILVSAPKSASAYCVHNLTGGDIRAMNRHRTNNSFLTYLGPDQKGCCPGKRRECQGNVVQVIGSNDKGEGECNVATPNHALLEVRYKDRKMVCNLR